MRRDYLPLTPIEILLDIIHKSHLLMRINRLEIPSNVAMIIPSPCIMDLYDDVIIYGEIICDGDLIVR